MSEMVLVTKSYLNDIANAIGSRLEESPHYTLSQMPGKIASIGLNNQVEIYGAPGIEITSTTTSSQLIVTYNNSSTPYYFSNNGKCILTLPSGAYRFENRVFLGTENPGATSISIFSKEVFIDGNYIDEDAIKLYPDGKIIYWYGLEPYGSLIDTRTDQSYTHYTVWKSGDWNGSISPTTFLNGINCLYGSAKSRTNAQSITWGTRGTINIENYTKLYICPSVQWVGTNLTKRENHFGIASGKTLYSSGSTDYVVSVNNGQVDYDGTITTEIDISNAPTGDYYIAGYGGYRENNSGGEINMQLYALWLGN